MYRNGIVDITVHRAIQRVMILLSSNRVLKQDVTAITYNAYIITMAC